jgi:predicted RNase H-like HicB family nuclease
MARVLTYPVQLTPAEEGGFVVTSPVLSIFTQGDTEEEALKNAEEAILCHLEGMVKDKREEPDVHLAMIQVEVPDTLDV